MFGLLLFLVKLVRAANDNIAPIFFNVTQSLSAYFWVGFGMSLFSLANAYFLTNIHEAVIETHQPRETEEEQQHQQQEKKRSILQSLPLDYFYLAAIYTFGFGSI